MNITYGFTVIYLDWGFCNKKPAQSKSSAFRRTTLKNI